MNNKKSTIKFLLLSTACIFIFRLAYIQIISNDYKIAFKKNIIRKLIEHPCRGRIYDRNAILLVYNEPIYDLKIIPKYSTATNKILFCKIFNITSHDYDANIMKVRKFSKIKPSLFIKNISHSRFATIQDYLSEFPGFFIEAKSTRGYTTGSLANIIGYLSEVNCSDLKNDTYYAIQDFIGKTGLEYFYEKLLRGKKGEVYKIVDVAGSIRADYKDGLMDRPSQSGKDIFLTIDIKIQQYADKLMKGKYGSIVAIEPGSGDIVVMGSYPSYNPNILKGNKISKNFKKLQKNPQYPFFNRAIMGMYPPGSIFKIVQALIGLQQKTIIPSTTIRCDKTLINCHNHSNPSNLHSAIKNSCNPYFYKVFRRIINQDIHFNKYVDTRIGFSKWRKYVLQFGFGNITNIDIPGEKKGFIPSVEFYDNLYGKQRWKTSTIRSLDIGQGEMLVTPLQMANLVAIIANRGFYYIPHLIKTIPSISEDNKEKGVYDIKFHDFRKNFKSKQYKLKKDIPFQKLVKYDTKKRLDIDKCYFEFVANAMADVTKGTARRAYIDDIVVCCKTGTAQNPHGKDHSVFVAFAPKENPVIAISVYVENAGWGGIEAASIGSLVIEKYIRGFISKKRKYLESKYLNP